MKTRHLYDIPFVGLKNGVHDFTYEIDNEFFLDYSQPDFSDSKLQVLLQLDKQPSLFLLRFEITGTVRVSCDRCGDAFDMDVWDEFKLVVKRVEDPNAIPQDEDPDVAYISPTESHLHVADWIHDFALLSIPMQHIHPDKENGESGCNKDVLAKLARMREHSHESVNPIWKDLDKFRNAQ